MNDRDRIMEALATVPGLVPVASAPDTPTAYAAWPVFESARYAFGKLTRPLLVTYGVLVLLPGGYDPDTVLAADGLLPQVMNALQKIADVDVGEPVQVQFPPSTSMPALRVRCTPQPERTR